MRLHWSCRIPTLDLSHEGIWGAVPENFLFSRYIQTTHFLSIVWYTWCLENNLTWGYIGAAECPLQIHVIDIWANKRREEDHLLDGKHACSGLCCCHVLHWKCNTGFTQDLTCRFSFPQKPHSDLGWFLWHNGWFRLTELAYPLTIPGYYTYNVPGIRYNTMV